MSNALRFQKAFEDYESIRSKFFNGVESSIERFRGTWDNVLASKLNVGLVLDFSPIESCSFVPFYLKWVWLLHFLSGDALYGVKGSVGSLRIISLYEIERGIRDNVELALGSWESRQASFDINPVCRIVGRKLKGFSIETKA
ncbi:hypothetical protein Tco_0058982 [Tanacetum coccineum]